MAEYTKLSGTPETSQEGNFVREGQELSAEQGFKFVSKLWYDKGTISYDEGRQKLAQGRAETEDIMATTGEMTPTVKDDKFAFLYKDGRYFAPNEHSLSQVSGWVGCGTWYPEQLMFNKKRKNDGQDAETLVAVIENGFRFIKPDKKFLFRTRKDGSLRAMLSDIYAILNNEWLINVVERIIPGGRLSHWDKCDGADTIYGNVLIPDSIRTEEDSDYGGGVSIGNSEIGVRQLTSMPWLFRAICMNGCIWGKETGKAYNRVHRAKKVDYAKEEAALRENITKQIPLVNVHLDQLMKTKSLVWDAEFVKPLFAQVAIMNSLPKADANELLKAYQAEPAKSCFGMVNACTRAGQKLSPERWVALDSFVGSVLNGNTQWDTIVTKAKGLSVKEVDEAFADAI